MDREYTTIENATVEIGQANGEGHIVIHDEETGETIESVTRLPDHLYEQVAFSDSYDFSHEDMEGE